VYVFESTTIEFAKPDGLVATVIETLFRTKVAVMVPVP
jgi:hypothetical protein